MIIISYQKNFFKGLLIINRNFFERLLSFNDRYLSKGIEKLRRRDQIGAAEDLHVKQNFLIFIKDGQSAFSLR